MADRNGRYQRIFEHSRDGVVITGRDGIILRANPAACRLIGRSEDEIKSGGRRALLGELGRAEAGLAVDEADRLVNGVVPVTHPDGHTVFVEVSAGVLPAEHGVGEGELGFAVLRDVTERRRADERLRRATRALRLLSRCSQAVARASSEEELFAEVCAVMVELGGYRMCWVGLAEEDQQRTLRPVAHAGFEDGFLAEAGMVWADVPRGRGPCGAAARMGVPVAGCDYANDPTLALWRDAAAARGYRSCTALPLFHDGERIGVLGTFSEQPEPADDEELGILMQLAQDVSRTVWSLRAKRAREAAEQALRVNEERLNAAQQHAHIGSWLYQPSKPLVWSDETYRLFQLPRAAPPTIEAVRAVVHPDDRDRNEPGTLRWALASGATDLSAEFRVVWPNGRVRWLQSLGTINRAANGSVIDAEGTVQDVTELKEAGLQAQRAAARLAVVLADERAGLRRPRTPAASGSAGAVHVGLHRRRHRAPRPARRRGRLRQQTAQPRRAAQARS